MRAGNRVNGGKVDTLEPEDKVSSSSEARRRPVLLPIISLALAAAVLYALRVSDDPVEVFVDLLLALLGLLAAGLASYERLRASRLLAGRAERHLDVMRTADVLPWECDAVGNVTFVGERITEHFGYKPAEALRLNLRDVVHPQEHDRLAMLTADGAGWTQATWRCLREDGSERWMSSTAMPNRAADGTLLGFTGATYPLDGDALEQQRLSDLANDIRARLDSHDVQAVFQPILSVATGYLIGAEALSRFPGSERNPEQWFTGATEVGLGVELEMLTLRRSLVAAQQLPEDIYLSLNVSPQTLLRPELLELLLNSGLSPDRLVVEVTEHASIVNYDQVLDVLGELRTNGVRLAVDDAGAGYASFRHILRLAPEIIKLDRSLIAGIHDDPALRALASAVVTFGADMKATITAEGIETSEELRCAQSLGIHAAQGYLFGRPTAECASWHERYTLGNADPSELLNSKPQATTSPP